MTDSLESYRKNVVAEHLSYLDQSDRHRGLSRSGQYARLLDELTRLASDGAKDGAKDAAMARIDEAAKIVWKIRNAIHLGGAWRPHDDLWRHDPNPLKTLAAGEAPDINRSDIEHAATRYLDLPFRMPEVDRLLVDLMMASDLFTYADEVMQPSSRDRLEFRQRHVAWAHLRFVAIVSAVLLVAGVVVGYAITAGLISPELRTNIFAALAAIFVLAVGYNILVLPAQWLRQRRERRAHWQVINAMLGVYDEFDKAGDVSARTVRKRVNAAAKDNGVDWSGQLRVLLNDIIKRTGRL